MYIPINYQSIVCELLKLQIEETDLILQIFFSVSQYFLFGSTKWQMTVLLTIERKTFTYDSQMLNIQPTLVSKLGTMNENK